MAKAGVEESAFRVDFGRKQEGAAQIEVMASYILRKFAGGEVSRYDQAMDVMDELGVPEGVNWLEIERQEKDDSTQETAARIVTKSGIVAELVGQKGADGEWSSVSSTVPLPPDSQRIFPVQSLFC